MRTNYKAIPFNHLIFKVSENPELTIFDTNGEVSDFTNTENLFESTLWEIRYKGTRIYGGFFASIFIRYPIEEDMCREVFIACLDAGLIYKQYNNKDDWSNDPEIALYLRKPELYYKLKGR